MYAEMRRSVSARAPSNRARTATRTASTTTRWASFLRIPLSMRDRRMSGFTAAMTASRITTGMKMDRILR